MMKRLTVAGLLLSLACAGHAQTDDSRQERIRAHQERIQQIIEQSRERRAQQAGESTASTSATKPGFLTPSGMESPSGPNEQIRFENWWKYRAFFYIPQIKTLEFIGDEQAYSDENIEANWSFSDKQLRYRWKADSSDSYTTRSLEDADLIYKKSETCLILTVRNRIMTVGKWTQPSQINASSTIYYRSDYKLYKTDSLANKSILLSPDVDQQINEWTLSIDREQGKILAQKGDAAPVLIGSRPDDSRPLEDAKYTIEVEAIDQYTSCAVVNIKGDWFYPRGIFAGLSTEDFEKIVRDGVGYKSLFDGVNDLGKQYGFAVEWETEESQSLAKDIPFPKARSHNTFSFMIRELDDRIFTDFPFTVVDNTKITIRASDQYVGDQLEKPRITEKIKENFPTTTKLYTLKSLSSTMAQELIKRELKKIVLTPSVTSFDATTSDTILYKENFYSAHLLPADTEWHVPFLMLMEEKLVTDPDGKAVIVTATQQTHEAINRVLSEIETPSSTVIGNEAAPLRRQRIQLVLLQGGEADTSATASGQTYDAQLPATYGIPAEDQKLMGFSGAVELGRSIVELIASPDDSGRVMVALGGSYSAQIAYKEERKPYLVLNAKILDDATPLAENTVMVDNEKPTFLGVTNLSGALILVISRVDSPGEPQ